MRAVLMLLVIGGCGAQGVPVAAPDAMELVWEGVYGMERESRPAVAWHDECRPSANGGERVITSYRGCIVAIVEATGAIDLQRFDVVSSSLFSIALAQWKHELLLSDFEPVDGYEVARAQAALRAVGL